jgi:hypothetical protein
MAVMDTAQAVAAENTPSQDFGVVSYTGIDDNENAISPGPVAASAGEDLAVTARNKAHDLGQTSSLDPLATPAATPPRRPPPVPDGEDVTKCLSEGAHNEFGRVYNRFMWCQRWELEAKRFTSGSTGTRLVASMTMQFSAVAYGRDDGKRGITVFFRGDSATYWPTPKGYIRPESMLYQRVGCYGESGCGENAAHTAMQIKDWIGRWTSFELTSDGTGSTLPDKVRRHEWFFNGYVIDSWNLRLGDRNSPRRIIRCDSATNFGLQRRGACIFDDVTPHLQYSLNDDKVDEVAKHIKCAQDEPFCVRDGEPFRTYPRTGGPKFIPGRFDPADRNDQRALHRIKASRSNPDPRYTSNRNTVRSTCATLPTDIYDTSIGQECDEYPFASTAEGAACCEPPAFDWDFSILGVSKSDNGCAGNALKKYYRDDRILYGQDGFFVHITNNAPAGPDLCEVIPPDEDEPDDNLPPPDLPPSVDAGIDVTGNEGSPVILTGSASDPEGSSLFLGWNATPGPDVDPGAVCSFSSTTTAATSVNCTDDGTFILTLTARDMANAPVSDSATLTLHNVAPNPQPSGPMASAAVPGSGPDSVPTADDDPATPPDTPGIHEPRPWQVFRAGTEVRLVMAFTEPGANDTHTCRTDWDDTSVSSYVPVDLTCRTTHTFAHPGMYTIKTRVTDDDDGTGDAEVMVVVYDPNAGFATGAGHLMSPADALEDGTGAGRAHFQFNPSYRPHDTGPVPSNGKVSYSIQETDFVLDSDALEWLVVTPDDKVAAKGTGTVDGQGGYGFVLYGYDADPDAIRLVVWPLAAGEYPTTDLLYDNRRGGGYDLDVADPQPIDNGSIQSHN